MKSFINLKNFINENNNFVLVGHKNADGDCYGTMVAFAHILNSLNKNFKIIYADPIPDNYKFLFKNLDYKVVENFNCENNPVFIFECNNFERSGIKLENCGITANFDHHPGNDYFGNVNIVDTEASSVGEIAVYFLYEFYKSKLNSDIANALYAAIHTDTGGFAYSNTKEKTFKACSILSNYNLDSAYVCTEIYENKSINRLRLTGFYLENLKLIENNQVAYGIIENKDLEKFNCNKSDCENFGAYARAVKGVEVGIFLLETDNNLFKLSIRSKGKFIVNKVAKQNGGGGHKFAAGCVISGNPEEIVKKIAKEIINQ